MHGISEFEVRVSQTGDAGLVVVRGEVALATVPDVRAAIAEVADATRVVMDLTDVTFMDSSAVHLFDDLQRTVAGLTFRLPGSAAGRQVLVMTGLIDRLPVEGS